MSENVLCSFVSQLADEGLKFRSIKTYLSGIRFYQIKYPVAVVDDKRNPSMLRVNIKQSKTDPFRKGVAIFVGRTGTQLCPVAALLDYLCARWTTPGPLFTFADGRMLNRGRFVERVRDDLSPAGVDQYCGHSFRIGAAITAAKKGVEDCIIKILGRWESLTYLHYVQLPREQLGGYSKVLAS